MSPRLRLQALLAVPDRQRTDEQWDELNELEIMLAAGNRERGPEKALRNGNAPSRDPRPSGGPDRKRSGRKFDKKRRKDNTPRP